MIRLAPFVLVSLVLVSLVIAGCGSGTRVPPMIIGPISAPPSYATFERLTAAVRAEGYVIEEASATDGVFAAPTLTMPRASFRVQCFADGHVHVWITGARRTTSTGVVIGRGSLAREAVHFADVLREAGDR